MQYLRPRAAHAILQTDAPTTRDKICPAGRDTRLLVLCSRRACAVPTARRIRAHRGDRQRRSASGAGPATYPASAIAALLTPADRADPRRCVVHLLLALAHIAWTSSPAGVGGMRSRRETQARRARRLWTAWLRKGDGRALIEWFANALVSPCSLPSDRVAAQEHLSKEREIARLLQGATRAAHADEWSTSNPFSEVLGAMQPR